MSNVRVRTAYDLERKYNLSNLSSVYKAVEKNGNQLTKVNNELENFVIQVDNAIEDLQDQLDGNIMTWFYSGEPTTSKLPASEWTTDSLKQEHIGDLYYDKDTGYAYRWTLDSETNVYSWFKLTDSDITEALAVANAAKDTADSKRRVFVVQPTPPYEVGDIWLKDDSDLYRCRVGRLATDTYVASDWILGTKYTDDTAANNAVALLNAYKTIVETTYVTNSDFIDANNSLTLRVNTVETVAEGKNKVFTIEPTVPYHVGDVYIKETTSSGITQNLIYVCQTERLTGFYNPDDFSLQPSYASESSLNIEKDRITSLVGQVGDRTGKTTTVTQDISSINARLDNTVSIVDEQSGIGEITLTNLIKNKIVYLQIHPTTEDLKSIQASHKIYASNTLYASSLTISFENSSSKTMFIIPKDLYQLNNTYDEFIQNNVTKSCYIIHRIGINSDGSKYILDNPTIETFDLTWEINEGNNKVYLDGYDTAYINMRAMIKNDYTTQFATEVYVDNQIDVSEQGIELSVSEKLGGVANSEGKVTSGSILLAINNDESEAKIKANKIKLEGFTTVNEGFSIDTQGNMVATSGNLGGWVITNQGLNNSAVKINSDGSSTIYTVADLIIIRGYMMGYQGFDLPPHMIEHYDLNGDGAVTSADYVRLQNLIGISMSS